MTAQTAENECYSWMKDYVNDMVTERIQSAEKVIPSGIHINEILNFPGWRTEEGPAYLNERTVRGR